MAMETLDRDGLATLSLAPRSAALVTDDEARLLTLFDAAFATRPAQVATIAATLVKEGARERLAAAVQSVAVHLCNGVFLERDE